MTENQALVQSRVPFHTTEENSSVNKEYTAITATMPESFSNESFVDSSPASNPDIVSALNWEGDIGVLPGTDMKFRLNDSGEVEMIFDHCDEGDDDTNGAQIESSQSFSPTEVSSCCPVSDSKIDNVREISQPSSVCNDANPFDHVYDYSTNYCVKVEAKTQQDTSSDLLKHVPPQLDSSFSNLATCDFCLKSGNAISFCGRFCSRQCVGRHAAKRRVEGIRALQSMKKSFKKPKLVDESYSLPYGKRRMENRINRPKLRPSTPKSLTESKKQFSWPAYLSSNNAEAVPIKVFEKLTQCSPLPNRSNNFEESCLLEAVDPRNQYVFSLVSIASLRGHRILLHFEGYSSSYDFWTYADSSLIFPCGFCNDTGRTLTLPPHYKAENFNMHAYAREHKLKIAPSSVFAEKVYSNSTGFVVGDRLEAVDRQNPEMVCVATVSDVIGGYILVHFDGWNHLFDYWTLHTSNFIHPVGWSAENGRKLSVPPGFEQEAGFNWNLYLKLKNAKAANQSLFSHNSHGFQAGMRLEVVDPRNKILVRVASIVVADEHRVKIHFDGWNEEYDVWMDVDDEDLHPIYWCDHSSERLFSPRDFVKESEEDSKCPIPGCMGHGHVLNNRFSSHYSSFGCPYSPQNLHREPLPYRLKHEGIKASNSEKKTEFERRTNEINGFGRKKRGTRRSFFTHVNDNESQAKLDRFSSKGKISPTNLSSTPEETQLESLINKVNFQAAYMNLISNLNPTSGHPLGWEKHMLALPGVQGRTLNEVRSWSTSQVSSFVNQLTGKRDCGDCFVAQEIDGKAFLMLTQSDLSTVLKLKLGPSVKIINAIIKIKSAIV